MRIFRTTYTDRHTGQQKQTKSLYLDFTDHRQCRRRLPAAGCKTQRQAERFGEMLDALVIARRYGDKLDGRLTDWLHSLPRSLIRKLVEIDLIDSQHVMASVTLDQHVADFETWLRISKAKHGFHRDPVYIHDVVTQVRYIIRGCGCVYWNELTRSAVEICLGKLDVASKTYNGYLAAIKLFGSWLVTDGRAIESPVAGLKPVRWQKTETRRALTFEEARRLLISTASGPFRYHMSGAERAALYLLAIETGFRSGELRELTVDCFDLDSGTVTLAAEHCKNRQEATQYLRRGRIEQWRAFLADRDPTERVFDMPIGTKVVRMLRADLKLAGILPTDERGTKITFHSLRYTLATLLDRAGVSLKERMAILRHSDKGNLTLGTYTTLSVFDLRSAVEKLPNLPWPCGVQQKGEMVA